MDTTRRELLGLAAAGAAVSLLGGCAPIARRFESEAAPLPLPDGDTRPAVRLLNRACFGPRPGDIARLKATGRDAFLKSQLAADEPEDVSLRLQLQRLDVGQIDDPELEDLPQGVVIRELQQAALLRAVHGRNQLLERMVDFWSNHFNVYARKGDAAFRLGADQRDVIRSNALGKFSDLLDASMHSAAMLAFLDNTQNLKSHPNENYARELMELHTLGQGNGYNQRDVQEVARCFTGWTIEDRFLHPRGKLRFDPDRHDDGPKLVLGHVIPAGGGENDARTVLYLLATHPATSRFIARKLVRQFYGTDEPKLEATVAERYRESGGDVRRMIEPIFAENVLAEAPPILKRPLEYIASSVRTLGGYTDGGQPLQDHLAAMGEPLYQWPMPDGYPIKTSSWTESMLPRWNFAYALAKDRIGGTGFESVDDPFEAAFGRRSGRNDSDLQALLASRKTAEAVALCLASPEFQWS